MSYNTLIPVITDPMLQSQGQCRANFQAINTVFAQNHVKLNTSKTQGMHSVLTFTAQSGNPTTPAGKISIYTKIITGIPHLFFRPESNGTPIQLTYPSISTGLQSTNPNVYLPRQYSFVAGPFVIYGGIITGVTDGQVITLTPTSILIYAGLTKINKLGNSVSDSATPVISGSGFTVVFPPSLNPQDFYYLAIGR